MPFSNPERHLRDIQENIEQVHQFVGDMSFDAYRQDQKTKAAVERKIQIITEAVIRLETQDPEPYPELDWKGYRAMGNFLRHSYHRVSDEIIWNTVKDDLPALLALVKQALRR